MRTLYYNGKLFTADPDRPWASAMAVEDRRITWVGDKPFQDASLRENLPERRIDLKGRFAAPGFIDSHMHLLGYGKLLEEVSLAGHTDSPEEVCRTVKKFVEEKGLSEGTWVCGRGWNQDYFQGEKRYLDRRDLDKISRKHPIFLTRACGHLASANTLAMELAGIGRDTKQPRDGRFWVDGQGEPLGIFEENAICMVKNAIPMASLEEVKAYICKACRKLNSYGITSVHSDDFLSLPQAGYETVLKAYRELEQEGRLTIKVYEQSQFENLEQLKEFVGKGYHTGAGTDYVKIGPHKIVGDGSLGARTALLKSPYEDAPHTCGMGIFTQEQLDEMIFYGHSHGMQTAVHAIGDGIMENVVRAYERALKELPRRNHRHGIVHCQITTGKLLEKFRELGLHGYIQSIFLDYDSKIVESRVGKERAAKTYQFKTLLDMGCSISNGSDCPVETPEVMKGIQCAVTRTSLDGARTFLPGQALTLEQALLSYTAMGAWAAFEEEEKGMLKAGMAADFVVLDRDITRIPDSELGQVQAVGTFLDGRCVYGREPLDELCENYKE